MGATLSQTSSLGLPGGVHSEIQLDPCGNTIRVPCSHLTVPPSPRSCEGSDNNPRP